MSTGASGSNLSARAVRKFRRDSEKAVEETRRQNKKTPKRVPKPSLADILGEPTPGDSEPNLVLTVLLDIPCTDPPREVEPTAREPSTDTPMADGQANVRLPQPITKHSYPKYKGSGDDDDADSYIKLFESVSIANREIADDDRLRIFPSLLRKKARSWYNHESIDPTGLTTWAELKEKFLRRFRELGYDSRVLTKLRNLQREKKESLRDYTERFLDLLDRIPKTGPGSPFSVQQAVDWYVTGLTREMETFCRRSKCDTIEDVIASAEAFETSTLNRRGRERRESKERKPKGGRRRRRGTTPSSEESSSDENRSSSEEEETSSSEEEKKRKKHGSAKKKGTRRVTTDRAPGDIASKMETLVKDFADLKVQVVGGHDRRKSPGRVRANLWCTTCGAVGHANTECLTTRPSYPVNAVEWAQPYYGEHSQYYGEASEETAYAVQSVPTPPAVSAMQVPRYIPVDRATTVPVRRRAPPGTFDPPPPRACYNCGEVGHFSPQCPHPKRRNDYAPTCSNCKKIGHTAPECDQPPVPRPAVRFVNTPAKEDVQVNQVEVGSDGDDEDEEWPAEEVMCARVETRSSKKSKEQERDTRKHERRTDDRTGKGKEKTSSKSDLRPARKASATREAPAVRPQTAVEDEPVRLLKRDYAPDIRNEVTSLLKEAIRTQKDPPRPDLTSSLGAKLAATVEPRRASPTPATQRAHYDLVEDLESRKVNITFKQLLEDNKTYRRMLMLSLRHPRKPRASTSSQVYQVESEDQGPLEIDVEIAGCCVRRVPIDSGSGVNIMTEDTARALGFSQYEPSKRVLRLADQTRRMPAGMLRNVKTIIGGADFRLTYIILQPMMKQGYDVLLGRPWLYGAQVRCDWRRHHLKFPHPSEPTKTITVPWNRVRHEGETPSTSAGYTSGEDSESTARSDSSGTESDYFVGFVACCSVGEEEEPEAIQPEDE